jgi:hypothetical protein
VQFDRDGSKLAVERELLDSFGLSIPSQVPKLKGRLWGRHEGGIALGLNLPHTHGNAIGHPAVEKL